MIKTVTQTIKLHDHIIIILLCITFLVNDYNLDMMIKCCS